MIRRILLPVLLISSLWSHRLHALDEISGPEKLVNGSFDAPGQGDGVPFSGWVGRSGQGGTYTFDLVDGKVGKAARISGSKVGRGHLYYNGGFKAKAGDVLRVRFWAKTENLKGGVFANLEGEPNNDGWRKINIGSSADWQLCETRVTVPKGVQGQEEPKIGLWFYHFGTGDLYLDEVSACVVTPDDAGKARRELARIRGWGETYGEGELKAKINQLADGAGGSPSPAKVAEIRKEVLTLIGRHQGSDGRFSIGVSSGLERVFLDEPYAGDFGSSLNIALARNESEGGQIAVISSGAELTGVKASLDGDLIGPGGAKLSSADVRIDLVGFVDTTEGKRPYQSTKLGWWPDPLLPNAAFDVKPAEVQPLLVMVTTNEGTAPGLYSGSLVIECGGRKVPLPLKVRVYPFVLPLKSHLTTLVLGSEEEKVAKFYGADPGGRIAERFVLEAAKRRMPAGGLLNGWGWGTPKFPKKDGGYDFSKADRWIDVLKPYVTRYPLVTVPRFRKFGGGEYDESFKRELGDFVKAYAHHLKEKGMLDAAVFYNLDEASDDAKLSEWEVCKEMYALSKKVAPDLPVMQCLNEFKGVQALAGHADIWDLYFGQYEQAGGPARLKEGDEITLAVCVWPSERPNLFVEYPLLDARIIPWICHREGARGFEYWDLFQTWDANAGNPGWWKSGNGTRTSWKLVKNHGDGLLLYPGPEGQPLSSLRLESLRDGLEDYEYLTLLEKQDSGKARELLKESREVLVTGVTTYADDPAKLLDLRGRIAAVLSAK